MCCAMIRLSVLMQRMAAAATVNTPAIVLSGGPMLNGKFRGKDIGSGTGVWQMSEMVRDHLARQFARNRREALEIAREIHSPQDA